MLIIRGNRRVTDIYLGEFTRLLSIMHSVNGPPGNLPTRPNHSNIETGPCWREFFGDTERSH
jgi:hypothetical protein